MALEISPILDRINKLVEALKTGQDGTTPTAVTTLLNTISQNILDIENNTIHKLERIKGATAYSRTFAYSGSTDNVTSIIHTGTTALGVETVTETITYVNAGIGDFRVNTIIYS
jgi:hypothetical protein